MGSKDRAEILLVGNELDVLDGLYRELRARSYLVTTASSGNEAFLKAMDPNVDVVVSELTASNFSGLELLAQLHSAKPRLPIILIADTGTTETVISATKLGAYDYLAKPFQISEVLEIIQRAATSNVPGLPLLAPGEAEFAGTGLIGMSRPMQDLYKQIALAAGSSTTVLIRGATGTGKELVAQAIHKHSSRASHEFVPINCSAIPETLFESEVFGHERGSFTGARTTRIGCFERAHEGTLFLDEIGDLPLPMQGKLLRALQEQRIQRIGARREVLLDVRVIAATHRDLESRLKTAEFREDLFHRLNVVVIRTPTLDQHGEDIHMLVRHFLRKIREKAPQATVSIEREAVEFLCRLPWPGNVRQLENTITNAATLAQNHTITLWHVKQICDPNRHLTTGATLARRGPLTDLLEQAQAGHICDVRAQVDRSLFAKAMAQAKGNQALVAKWLGITRKTVGKQLRRFGLLSNVENHRSSATPQDQGPDGA